MPEHAGETRPRRSVRMLVVKWAPALVFGVVCGIVLDGIQWPLLVAFAVLHTWTWEFAYHAGWRDKTEQLRPIADRLGEALKIAGVPVEDSDG